MLFKKNIFEFWAKNAIKYCLPKGCCSEHNRENFISGFLICPVTTGFTGHVVLWVESLHPQSPPC